jgi:hypothetical protein
MVTRGRRDFPLGVVLPVIGDEKDPGARRPKIEE